jgi:hypothetical protein
MLDYELSNATFEPPNHAFTFVYLSMVKSNKDYNMLLLVLGIQFLVKHSKKYLSVVNYELPT